MLTIITQFHPSVLASEVGEPGNAKKGRTQLQTQHSSCLIQIVLQSSESREDIYPFSSRPLILKGGLCDASHRKWAWL